MVFSIAPDVFEVLPSLCVGLVVAEEVHTDIQHLPAADTLLDEAVADAEKRLVGMHASDDPRIKPYREAFHALGMSPSRYPSSNLALLKRIAKGKGLWRVNPIVDLGNAISIAYALPLGAHAVDKNDVLELRFSRNDDTFIALGEQEVDSTLAPGELVYAVGTKVQTRRWTWRQSECGKVDAGTSRILFPLDGFIGCNDGVVRQACYELASYLHKYFGAQTEVYLLDATCPYI